MRRPDAPLPFKGKTDPVSGRRLCCWCGTPVTGRRVCWCSDDCVLDYKLAKGDQSAARRFVWKLHRGVCQLCQTDVNAHRRKLVEQHGHVPAAHRDQIKWDADHIVPIVEGGRLDRTNLRTLCRACHKGETKKLRGRLSAKRRTKR